MLAGLAGIVLTLAYTRRSRRVVEQTVPSERVVERRTEVYDDPNVPPPPASPQRRRRAFFVASALHGGWDASPSSPSSRAK